MSCSCTEEFRNEGNAIIGFNKVTCQECLDAQAVREAQKAKDAEIAEKKAYLASTDYIVLRQTEQNTLTPEAYAVVLADRQAARDRINELQA